MKKLHFLIIILSFLGIACSEEVEHDPYTTVRSTVEHIQAIRDYSGAQNRCEIFTDSFFVDHIINTKLNIPEHKKYITYKPWLVQLTPRICKSDVELFVDTLDNGDIYRIEILPTAFDSSQHTITYSEDGGIAKIDGNVGLGSKSFYNKVPESNLKLINIFKNGIPFNIPPIAYNNLFQLKLCNFTLPQTIGEAYVDPLNNRLYLYIFGGIGAEIYMVKLVFENEDYICQIASRYDDISCFGNFRGEPIWY